MNDVSAARHITALYRIGSLKDTSARAFSHQWTDLTSTQWHTDFTDLTSMGQISPHPNGTPQETKSDLANDAIPISTIPWRFAIPEYKKYHVSDAYPGAVPSGTLAKPTTVYAPSGSLECKSRTGSNYGNWDLLIGWQKSSAIATCQGSQDAEHHLPSVAFAAVAFVGLCSERPAAADIMGIGSPWSK